MLFVTAYPPHMASMGGGGWIDRRLISALERLNYSVDVFPVMPEPRSSRRDSIRAEVRTDLPLLFKCSMRMAWVHEPYVASKFRMFSGWKKRVSELQTAARGHLVVASQWPSLLLALDAALPVRLGIAHNVEWLISERYAPRVLRWLRDTQRQRLLEIEVLTGCRDVLSLSHADSDLLNRYGISVQSVDWGRMRTQRSHGGGSLGFVGKSSWPPNRELLSLLVSEFLPELRRRHPAVDPILVVAGEDSQQLHVPDVMVLGAIDDIGDFYRLVSVVAVPRGERNTGVSVKLLEAHEYGLACIADPATAKAMGNPEWLDVASDSDEMLRLIGDNIGQHDTEGDPHVLSRNQDATIDTFSSALQGILSGQ